MPETRSLSPIEEVKTNLMRMEPEFKRILPAHVSAEKFVRVVITAIMNNPSLLEGDRRGLYKACSDAASDGLIPDGREGAIVPYKGKARWMPMVAGIAKKVRNSGEIGDLDAQVVCENDEYDSWIDEKGRHFKWRKARGERGAETLTFAYAIGRDGTFYFEEVSAEDMKSIEASSPSSSGPWKGPFKNEMKRKSAIRRLAKYRLPSSTDLTNLTQTEDDIYEAPEKPTAQTEPDYANRLRGLVLGQVASSEIPTQVEPEIEFPGNGPKEIPL